MSSAQEENLNHPWLDFVPSPGTDEMLAALSADAARLLRCALRAREQANAMGRVTSSMLLCLADDCESLRAAVAGRRLRLALMVARAIFEGAVNLMRIAVGGDDVLYRALAHATQKAVRDLERESEIEGSVVAIRRLALSKVEIAPNMKALLDEFTAKSGREKTGWIDESIEDKIAVIAKSGRSIRLFILQSSLLGTFRHGSEVLHGSFCGASYSLGDDAYITNPMSETDPRPDIRASRVSLVTQSSLSIVSEVIQVVAPSIGLTDLAKESADALRRCMEVRVAKMHAARPQRGNDETPVEGSASIASDGTITCGTVSYRPPSPPRR